MDPFLEDPQVWPALHPLLISETCKQIQPELRARGYYAQVGQRLWVTQVDRPVYPDLAVVRVSRNRRDELGAVATAEPDEPIRLHAVDIEIRESFIDVYDAKGHRLVTSIEYVSPTNKSDAQGRELYLRKQRELADAGVNLVEVDLLRRGPHVVCVPKSLVESIRPWDYLVCVWRPNQDDFEVYPISVRNRLPRIRLPLVSGDADSVLDLQAAFDQAYDAGPFPAQADYRATLTPPLSSEDDQWAVELLRQHGFR
jgi:hypothetical protein